MSDPIVTPKMIAAASNLFDLIKKQRKHIAKHQKMTPPNMDGVKVLWDAVDAALFNPNQLYLDTISITEYTSDSGVRDYDKTYINSFCPLAVTNHKNYPQHNDDATGWLDAICRYTFALLTRERKKAEAVKMIAEKMAANAPLEPIQLPDDAGELYENLKQPRRANNSQKNYLALPHIRDSDPLKDWVGIHSECGHSMDLIIGKKSAQSAIVCKTCCLRFTFPKTVMTYAHLRKDFEARRRHR